MGKVITLSGRGASSKLLLWAAVIFAYITIAFVCRPVEAEDVTPDKYEPDDTYLQAKEIEVGGQPQQHNLHKPGDVDYVKFYARKGEYYGIEVYNTGQIGQLSYTLYKTDGITPIGKFGSGYVLLKRLFNEEGVYYASISNADPNVFGSGTDYTLSLRRRTESSPLPSAAPTQPGAAASKPATPGTTAPNPSVSWSFVPEPNAPKAEDDSQCGKIKGAFRGQWFNYYERGLSFSDCGQDKLEGGQKETAIKYLESTVKDLEAAIRIRKDEGWHTRTYGMHYVDYFPHRELGIAYFLLGEEHKQSNNALATSYYEKAQKELAVSVGYKTTTSKAVYYLNEVRGRLNQKTQGPVIKLKPADNLTANCMYTVEGIATSANYVRPVILNGKPLPYCLETKGEKILDKHFQAGLSAQSCGFKTEVDLCALEGEGVKAIKIEAVDAAGRSSEEDVKVTLDREGPAIAINSVGEVDGKTRVTGAIYDNYGIKEVLFNGENRFTGKSNVSEKEWPFDVTLTTRKIAIKATNKAGNTTEYTLPEVRQNAALTDAVLLAQNGASNSDAAGGGGFSFGNLNVEKDGHKTMEGTLDIWPNVPDKIFRTLGNFVDGAKEFWKKSMTNQSSLIIIKPEGRYLEYKNSFAIFEKSLRIMITVSNLNEFSDLILYNNDKEIKCPQKDNFKKVINSYTFHCTIPVNAKGDNEIKLVAYTKQKNEEKQSSINVQKLDMSRRDMLLRVAIIALDKKGNLIDNTDDKYKKISAALEGSERFNIVNIDNKRENIVDRYKIKDDTITPDSARNAAKEANVDMFLLLTIDKRGKTTKFVETGCFVTTTPKDTINCDISPEKTIVAPNDHAAKASEKEIVASVEDSFPFVRGEVKKARNERLEINRGKEPWKIYNGTRLYLFNATDMSKRLLCSLKLDYIRGCEDIVVPTDEDYYGRAVVTDAKETKSEARVIYIPPGNKPKADDIIMTK
ncbi:conserved hypothetical protein, secreted [Candidatus Magnetobacterium bavaricum]|uniref:Uncharacterized protein n=1 Tax=Candidatus Magnetobacterium bavaricum TaxID=29290 RepID=A0A0F3GYR9_9BACT|nr:conserved hypothetical protein, secreted [Candidatus Magnetobacterium bavaricum]